MRPLIIGLTGGIATGKSLVSDTLEAAGAQVIDADSTYHRLLAEDPDLTRAIAEAFGPQVLDEAGRVDRRSLGAIVFRDPDALARLNGIAHPAVIRDVEGRLTALGSEGCPLVILSVPLLYESGMDAMTDHVVVVACSPENQVTRLMARAGIDAEEARRRIETQMPLAEKAARAWRSLDNDGDPETTRQAARDLLVELQGLAADRAAADQG